VILGIDVSHHQGAPDLAAVRRSGRSFVVVKATEGTAWTDPQFAASRTRAADAGLLVGMYHFARAGDPGAEAADFARAVGPLRPGEFAVLDWEVSAPDPVAWCAAWLTAVRDALGVTPLLYLDRSTRDRYDWTPVVREDVALWLAAWDGRTDAVAAGAWPVLAMKQYSDAGAVPGVDGPVDLDVFYGGEDQLRAHGKAAG
jgi:GH25 family lysozyme M1 (1,4-beta-N-acetylmuramidase)